MVWRGLVFNRKDYSEKEIAAWESMLPSGSPVQMESISCREPRAMMPDLPKSNHLPPSEVAALIEMLPSSHQGGEEKVTKAPHNQPHQHGDTSREPVVDDSSSPCNNSVADRVLAGENFSDILETIFNTQ